MPITYESPIDMTGNQIQNVGDGSAPTDAVNKSQLDNLARGLDWKDAVQAASTANVNLASPGTTLDGVTLVAGRVLLKNQSAGAENGIYDWTASGSALVRSPDADTAAEIAGAVVSVTAGSVNADRVYQLTTDSITLDTTSLSWSQLGGGLTPVPGNGISVSGAVVTAVARPGGLLTVDSSGIGVDTASLQAPYKASVGDGSTTDIVVTHSLGTRDVSVEVWRNSTPWETVLVEVDRNSTSQVTLKFTTAPTSNQYRVKVSAN